MQKKRFDPLSLAAGILLGLTAVLNISALFFLPTTLSTALSDQRVSSLTFLAGGILLVGVSGMMAVFGENPKKWIFIQGVLFLADVALVIYNIIIS
jgi:hypothetical protein